MTDNKNQQPDRARRLAQARRFLDAGRTGIDAPPPLSAPPTDAPTQAKSPAVAGRPKTPEKDGGGDRPDPTRFGDWEKNGRCIDF